jgi:hypothetical protein
MTATAADKYLIKPPEPIEPVEPKPISERDALKILVSATGKASCSYHEVGPLAAHLIGPIGAVPPYGHDDHEYLAAQGHRTSTILNALIIDACGFYNQNTIGDCTCDGLSVHSQIITFRDISQGRVVLAQQNTTETQARIARAIKSGDIDRLLHAVEPRAWCLCILVDRARAEHGGNLPEVVIEAAVVLARTLAGRTRWDIRTGYSSYPWPRQDRMGAAQDTADHFFKADFIFNRLVLRLIEGR